MNEFKMRVIKHVMEHLKTKGKNTITPRLFVKTKAGNYKILELPGVLFENITSRDVSSYAIKYINNNTNTEFCCFVAEAKMGKIILSENSEEIQRQTTFDGVTFVFQGVTDKESEVMAFTIDDESLSIKPMVTGSAKDSCTFESPFKHLF
tara:strand:- start:12914 stop:13363 length:450 start_codon:yes stop_codon:yes gene_type:complete